MNFVKEKNHELVVHHAQKNMIKSFREVSLDINVEALVMRQATIQDFQMMSSFTDQVRGNEKMSFRKSDLINLLQMVLMKAVEHMVANVTLEYFEAKRTNDPGLYITYIDFKIIFVPTPTTGLIMHALEMLLCLT